MMGHTKGLATWVKKTEKDFSILKQQLESNIYFKRRQTTEYVWQDKEKRQTNLQNPERYI